MDLFRTPVVFSLPEFGRIGLGNPVLTMGSCFAENIGNKLKDSKFKVLNNPAGIMFNPLSIAKILNFALSQKVFLEEELSLHNKKWFNFNFHSSFSNANKDVCLNYINGQIDLCRKYLKDADTFILTFGTAWYYSLKETGEVVANCYKIPSGSFCKELLDFKTCCKLYETLLNEIKVLNPKVALLITVSPVRHWKDGAVENQRSKSLLTLLAHWLKDRFDYVHYFPSYEIMMDELRDYRFYKEDMLHPSEQAINYIWDRFCEKCITDKANKLLPEIKAVVKAIKHQPFDSSSESFKQFAKVNIEKIKALSDAIPEANFTDELIYFNQFL